MMIDLLGAWRGRSGDQVGPAAASDRQLPTELLACIDRARVRHSRRDDQEGCPIIKLRAPAFGEFRWMGLEDAADRVAALWPELAPPLCVRAAQLLEATVSDVAMTRLEKTQAARLGVGLVMADWKPERPAASASLILRSPWGDEAPFAHVAIEAERPATSALLGPDGKPMRYATPALGFDLRGRR